MFNILHQLVVALCSVALMRLVNLQKTCCSIYIHPLSCKQETSLAKKSLSSFMYPLMTTRTISDEIKRELLIYHYIRHCIVFEDIYEDIVL